MNIVDVIEFLKDQDDMDMLDEFCHEFNYIMNQKRADVARNKKDKINCGDIVKVQMGAPEGYVEMYVKKLNPKKAVCQRGNEVGKMVNYNVPYQMISEVVSSVRTGNQGERF